MSREELIHTRLSNRLHAIMKAVPPIEPPAVHWLNSDAGSSYCWSCAIIARGLEFELGPLIKPRRTYLRDEWEDIYFDGIDGGWDLQSDHTEACEICHRTLSYILTEYGVREEFAYYLESPLTVVRDEESYALDRLCLNIWHGSPRKDLLAASAIVAQAYRVVTLPQDRRESTR